MKKNAKILVIDDDPDFVEAVTIILESKNYKVISASDPTGGLEMILSEEPDLILLDIMMESVFDGFSLCHKIKSSSKYKKYCHVPIIMISAVKNQAGFRFGFNGLDQGMSKPDLYLDKPVKPKHLLVSVENLLKEKNN